MTTEPRTQHEYGAREIDAARRVLVDLGQVLGSWFSDSIVVVGGWVPDLLLPEADEPAVAGSRATGARKLTEDFLSAFPTHIRKGQNRACTHCTPEEIQDGLVDHETCAIAALWADELLAGPRATGDVFRQILYPDPDRIDHPQVGQFADLAQAVDGGVAHAQLLGDIRHTEELSTPAVEATQVGQRGRGCHT
jgi:hypothetical protein